MSVLTGLDSIESAWPKQLQGARVGLVCHPASITKDFVHAVTVFEQASFCKLTALFGPQHGIQGHTQDNMIEWEGGTDEQTGLPLYSLYGEHRQPTTKMLEGLDAIVIDLQDVGARYYTFIWTMDLIFRTAHECGVAVVVLDRPNPINGLDVEGTVLEKGFESFVGLRPLPMRHGMTIAEIARYLAGEYYPNLSLDTLLMQGWKRDMYFEETNLPWVLPSPNMPTNDTAVVYPGKCLLEATNVSEGRGCTRPFEIIGAPWINPTELALELSAQKLPGVVIREMGFQPTFQKHAGELCGGVQFHVSDRALFKPVLTTTALLCALKKLYPQDFMWNEGPYEYEHTIMPIDILAGTSTYREYIDAGTSALDIEKWWMQQSASFLPVRSKYLLY